MEKFNTLCGTSDGSHTVQSARFDETYHSTHGAIAESRHVFIHAGLHRCMPQQSIHVLEVGFGTGLNALLTALESKVEGCQVYYEAIELYPIDSKLAQELNFAAVLHIEPALLQEMHACAWEQSVCLSPTFTLHKKNMDLQCYQALNPCFDLIYFDAFSANTQPELWSEQIFATMYRCLVPGGILVTYASKGIVKRALRAVGFDLERLPGAAGKRHMLRATKPKGI